MDHSVFEWLTSSSLEGGTENARTGHSTKWRELAWVNTIVIYIHRLVAGWFTSGSNSLSLACEAITLPYRIAGPITDDISVPVHSCVASHVCTHAQQNKIYRQSYHEVNWSTRRSPFERLRTLRSVSGYFVLVRSKLEKTSITLGSLSA